MGCVSKVTLWLSRSIPQRPHSRLRPRGQVTEKHRGLQRARIVLFLLCPTRHLASSLGFREYSLGKIPVAVGVLCQLGRAWAAALRWEFLRRADGSRAHLSGCQESR